MTDEEKLREIVRKAAAFVLPSNTQEFHLDMFTNSLMASGVKIGKNTNVPRWIPVTERLPNFNEKVLVITANGNFKVANCNFYDDGTKAYWMTNDGLGGKNITHWMPLPDAPKDGE